MQGLRRIPATRTLAEPHVCRNHWPQRKPNAVLGVRRGDVWIESLGGTFPFRAMLDATVVCPSPRINGVGTRPLLTADIGSRNKMQSYYTTQWVIPPGELIPISLEPTGALTSTSLDFFKTAARCLASHPRTLRIRPLSS